MISIRINFNPNYVLRYSFINDQSALFFNAGISVAVINSGEQKYGHAEFHGNFEREFTRAANLFFGISFKRKSFSVECRYRSERELLNEVRYSLEDKVYKISVLIFCLMLFSKFY